MKKVDFPDIAYSGRLEPCIAIGIYNPSTRRGYMIHEAYLNTHNLEPRLKIFKKILEIQD